MLGELVADDSEREREDAAAEPLEAAPDNHQGERVGQAGDDRSNGEQRERDREQPLLAEHVTEAAEDRRRDRRDEEIRGDHPGDAARRGAELALEVAQGRDDRRLREDEGEGAEAEDQEGAAGWLPGAG